jgi:hypothetical protein
MKPALATALSAALLAATPAFAIDAKYAKKLERSGCTQLSEMQGCDINKTREENAKAGFASAAPAAAEKAPVAKQPKSDKTPYAGEWVAVGPTGGTVARIRIDEKEKVWVNGKPVKAKRSDGGLVFKQGFVTYRIQGDRRLQGEDTWTDSDAKSSGKIVAD